MKFFSSKSRRRFSPATRNRVCATAFLGTYLLGAVGFPVELSTQIDKSTPFPCQDHRCGCRSAEQCWRECCCFTRDEKLAWAKAHRVQVPEHLMPTLVASAAADEHDHEHADHHDDHGSCGHDHGHVHASSAAKPCKTGVCATAKNSTSCQPHATTAKCGSCGKKSDSKQSSSVVVIEALKCQGLATYWCSAGAVVPPPPILSWQFDWTCQGQVFCEPLRPLLLSDAPPTPPPQV